MSPYQLAKIALVDLTGLSRDALHIYAALIVFFGSCLLFRWKARSWKPWLLVLLAAIAGEAIDIRDAFAAHGAPIQGDFVGLYIDSLLDVLNTMVMPTMILLATRFTGMFREDAGLGDQPEVVPPTERLEVEDGNPVHRG